MEESKKKDNSFLIGLCITLGTIIIGLVSYIFYSSRIEAPVTMCEYNGWAYRDGEKFDSSDGCNQCACSNGSVVCTEMACTNSN